MEALGETEKNRREVCGVHRSDNASRTARQERGGPSGRGPEKSFDALLAHRGWLRASERCGHDFCGRPAEPRSVACRVERARSKLGGGIRKRPAARAAVP